VNKLHTYSIPGFWKMEFYSPYLVHTWPLIFTPYSNEGICILNETNKTVK